MAEPPEARFMQDLAMLVLRFDAKLPLESPVLPFVDDLPMDERLLVLPESLLSRAGKKSFEKFMFTSKIWQINHTFITHLLTITVCSYTAGRESLVRVNPG